MFIFRILYIFDGGIHVSNLNPRKMAGIQDSNLVFKGPIHVEVPELKDRRRFRDPGQNNDWI